MPPKWPSPQDFNEAIQNPAQCFKDESLRHGAVLTNALGLPRVESGNFANVYKIQCSDGDWAVRCFTHFVPDNEQRYKLLSNFILQDDLVYTVTFDFQRQGIKVGNNWFPIVKMEWVQGEHFLPWIDKHIEDPQAITDLAERFLTMTSLMQAAGIAHGDLQHGNMIVVNNDIRLVDYDGMYVPAMTGMKSNELGHPNYQHPQRDKLHFGSYLDNFSAWMIYTSLQIIARDRRLWTEYGRGERETILFSQHDLRNPFESAMVALLRKHWHADIRAAANSIIELLMLPAEQVPPPAVARQHLNLREVKALTWFDRTLMRTAAFLKRMQSEAKPKASASEAAEMPLPEPRQKPLQPLPEWLQEYVKQNPVAAPLAETKAPQPEPPLAPPLEKGATDSSGKEIYGPFRLREYEITRLISEALRYTDLHRFEDAKTVFAAAQDAIRIGAAPRILLESLRCNAAILAEEAASKTETNQLHEAESLYQKAVTSMYLLSDMRNGKPERDDDLKHVEYLCRLAEVYQAAGKSPEMTRALYDAISILDKHQNTKREKNRILKKLGTGIT